MNKISVYITSYNQVSLLSEAIESVLNQSLRPFEIIIVDDGSTDGSREFITSMENLYPEIIRPIFHTENRGVAHARVSALREVKGDFVTYLDGDDIYLPTKLEDEFAKLTREEGVDIVFSNTAYVSTDLSKMLWVWSDTKKPPEGDIFIDTFTRNFPRKSIFRMEMVNYSKFKQVGFHDLNLSTYEDYDLRIRLTNELKAAYVDKVLSWVRLGDGGLSSKFDQHIKNLEYIFYKNQRLLERFDASTQREVEKSYWEYCIRVVSRNLGLRRFFHSPRRFFTFLQKSFELKNKAKGLVYD